MNIWMYETYSDDEDFDAVKTVVNRSTWWTKGEEVQEFEKLLADYNDREYCVTFNSGSSALYASLVASEIEGKVILPAFTYIATLNSIKNAGLTPIFADIETDTYGLDIEHVKHLIDKHDVFGVVPTHLLGYTSKYIKEIEHLAREHNIKVLVDGAPSLGSTLDGKPSGSFGDTCMFSFAFNKIISTGEGGCIVTDDKHIYENLKQVRFQSKDSNLPGFNMCMPSMNAALGISQFNKIDEQIQKRRNIARRYNMAFKDLPFKTQTMDCVFQKYQIDLPDHEMREDLKDYLNAKDIPSCTSYDMISEDTTLANSYKVSRTNLCIPLHTCLMEDQIQYIIDNICEFYE